MERITLTGAARIVAEPTRTITGLVVPFEQIGYTSAGATRFIAGSIRPPGDVARVKLLTQHDQASPAVGVGDGFAIAAEGVSMRFRIPAGPEGDTALRLAMSGQRDGLSVGVAVYASHTDPEGTMVVSDAEITEVSLVTIPAFDSAQILAIAAQKGNPMSDPNPTPPEPEPAPEPAPDEPTGVTMPAPVTAAAAVRATAAPVRAILPPGSGTPAGPRTVIEAASVALEYLRGGNPPSMLRAALADLVPADDVGQGLVGRPQWVGELWTHSRTARPIIDSISRGTLTGLTVTGWVWNARPIMADYAGAKAAIPSNKVTTAAVTATAERKAWGLDVDRAYIDLGAPGFLADLFAMATDSYRNVTEAEVAAALIAAATALTATDLEAWVLEAVGAAAALGSSLDFTVIASDVFNTFGSLSNAQVSWIVNNGDAGATLRGSNPAFVIAGVPIYLDPTLPAGTILGGDARAATFYEVSPPVRVYAENIPNGGVDVGVFGYSALIINDPAGLFKNGTGVAGRAAKA